MFYQSHRLILKIPWVLATSVSSSFKLLAASLFPSSSSRTKASTAPSELNIPHAELPDIAPPASIMDIDDLLPIVRDSTPNPDLALETTPDPVIDLGASTIRLVGPSARVKSPTPPSSPEYANPSPFKGKSLVGLPPSSSQLHLPLPFASSSTADLFSSRSAGGFSKSTPAEMFASSSTSKFKPLYPSLNPSSRSFKTMTSDSLSIPGDFPQPPARSYPAYANSPPRESKAEAGIPTTMDPNFTFRAPLPESASAESSKELAKAKVLAEMRRRMAEEAAIPPGEFSFVSVPVAAGGGAKKRARDDDDGGGDDDGMKESPSRLKARFDDAHQKQFDKYVVPILSSSKRLTDWSIVRMPSIADHYAARRSYPSPRKSGPGARLSANGLPRVRPSLANNNRAGAKRLSTAAQRLSAIQATAPRLEDEGRPGKRARMSTAIEDMDRPSLQATEEIPKPTLPASAISPRVRISDTPMKLDPNSVDVTAQTKRKVDTATANARARRKSRSSMGRQSLSRNAVLGNQPGQFSRALDISRIQLMLTRTCSQTQRTSWSFRLPKVFGQACQIGVRLCCRRSFRGVRSSRRRQQRP